MTMDGWDQPFDDGRLPRSWHHPRENGAAVIRDFGFIQSGNTSQASWRRLGFHIPRLIPANDCAYFRGDSL